MPIFMYCNSYLTFRFSYQNPLLISVLFHKRHMPTPFTLHDFITVIIFGEELRIINIVTVLFPLISSYIRVAKTIVPADHLCT